MALDETPGSPDWWLVRLGRQLADRRKNLDLWWRYYSGDQPLPQGPAKAVQAYRDFQKMCRTNFCAVAVDASVFRLQAIGVADGKGKSDDGAWSWWQRNRLDARQKQVYRLALAQSAAYVSVGPHPRDERRPLIVAEHPRQTIVEDDPETGERAAGLKVWYDPIEKVSRATLYLPDRILRYSSVRRSTALTWGMKSWDLLSDDVNTYGVVPLVAFQCRSELAEAPQPEFYRGLDIQDRVNLGVLNRMTAERYSAFRQKYVTGHVFNKKAKTETDPETGLEVIVGYEVLEQPFVPDPGAVWASEGKDTKFGEFSQTDLHGYLKTHEADIRDFLLTTHTPAHVYAGDLVNIATDTVMALEAMHLAKVGEHMLNFGESWEDVLAVAALVAGDERDLSAAEMRWADPRKLNPAVLADRATKLHSIGYPLEVLAEDLGESPQRVRRIVAGQAGQALLGGVVNSLAPTFQQPGLQSAQARATQAAVADFAAVTGG